MTRLIKLFGIFLLLTLCCVTTAFAAEQLPADWAPEPEAIVVEDIITHATRDNIVYHDTMEAAAAQMRAQVANQQETVVVHLKWPSYDSSLHKNVWQECVTHTGVSNEGDAMRWVYGGYKVSTRRSVSNGYCYITFTYAMTYYTTPSQEVALQDAIEAFVKTYIEPGMSDYEKFCVIYDWMCENITYDYDNLYDNTYKLKYTAYAAMFNKTAVCQGYAVLLYRMLLESGVDCRVITGIGSGGGHAWNIVRLDGLYYNADSTWDAIWYQAIGYYNYCLQCEENFTDNYTDHFRDAEYDTEEFHRQYVMATKDYDPTTSGAPAKFDIDVARMILGNSLEFQFGVSTDKIPDKTGYYAVIEKTWADGTTTTKTIPAENWGTAGVYHAVVYDGLAAKEMGDTFYVTIYNGNGVAVSNAKQDAVRDYVSRAYGSQSAKGKTMMVDMLNYGAAAQVHFNYGTSDLANSQLTDAQKAAGTQTTPTMTNNVVKGTNYTGSRFILSSSIQVQIGFKGLKDTMYAIYAYTNNNGEKKEVRIEGTDFVTSGSSKIGVELSELVYADARTQVEITVYNANGTVYGYAEDSIESCCVRSNGDLYVALMKFADSAKAYLY